MGQATDQRDSSIIEGINDLGRRMWVLERRLECQASDIECALKRIESAEEELKARIRILEQELIRQSK
jgi:hypothetical protein